MSLTSNLFLLYPVVLNPVSQPASLRKVSGSTQVPEIMHREASEVYLLQESGKRVA
jgi:hypothetical protein